VFGIVEDMMTRAVLGVLSACFLVGCSTRDASVLGGDPVKVTSRAEACTLSASTALAGKVVFDISNSGTEPMVFSVLANNEVTVIAASGNVAPGSEETLKTTLMPGGFMTACTAVGSDKKILNPFEVTGENLK
jgi:iron uptake system component EfeO